MGGGLWHDLKGVVGEGAGGLWWRELAVAEGRLAPGFFVQVL